MSRLKTATLFLLSFTTAAASAATISTVAGGGTNTVNTATIGSMASLNDLTTAVADSSGNIYFAGQGLNGGAIVYEYAAGWVYRIAGTGSVGNTGNGGAATSATFGAVINGLAVDSSGNIYISDEYYSVVRKVTASTGNISLFAGKNTTYYGGGYSGDGGQATLANINGPMGLAVSANYLYIADSNNRRIRRVLLSTGVISTYAGSGTQGYSGDGGAATSAKFDNPWALAYDPSGYIYVSDIGLSGNNCVVRRITASTGIINTFAGQGSGCGYSGDGGLATSAELNAPKGLSLDGSGNLYIADSGSSVIREVVSGVISTVAGNGSQGFSGDGGPATSAEISLAQGVGVVGTAIYIADTANGRIREVQ